MAKDFSTMEDSNRSTNPSIHQVSDPARRTVLRGAGLASLMALLYPLAGCATRGATGGGVPPAAGIGFASIPPGMGDALVVPPGYVAQVLAPWGDPVGLPGNMTAFRFDGSNSASEQAAQLGMHHDGVEFFPIDGSSTHGLIALNHEYTDDGLLHTDGMARMTAEKVKKSQNAHGLSVYEVRLQDGRWEMVRPSRYARRVTMDTPFEISGPAAGHPMMRTREDPAGRTALGTLNNCASSQTPWGTYLSGEENWMFYFAGKKDMTAHDRRWGMRERSSYQWDKFDPRFDPSVTPNEPNRFGWVVELDPTDPTSTPVKRTALGRAAHEGAWVALTRDQRAVVYSGEDARFEYIYKFVSRDRMQPGGARANRHLLDHGTLYVARFDADGRGRWLPLVHGQGPLTAANGFANQGEVVIKSRQACDLLGATKMDRPEWLTIDTASRWVYCTLTNNSSRGQAGQPGVDAANPRANNTMGQIIRWLEDDDFDGIAFSWNHLVLAGDPANERAEARGNIKGDLFACPDGIAFGPNGLLWIQTDAHATQMYKGEFRNIGNNQMLACDVRTGEVRRFLTGPTNCEITGVTFTPDGRNMFISVQHPGETPSDRSDPAQPARFSNWPDFRPGGRPRSANVVIRRVDGGVIGS
ncbi:MAG: PhoX family protein [Ramlibacter sp.]|jgi:secreted PhoX family phosphatase